MHKDKSLRNRIRLFSSFICFVLLASFPGRCENETTCVINSNHLLTHKEFSIDSSFFDGYYIVLYTKKEIKDIIRNRRRKIQGLSYEMPVDYDPIKYFVSRKDVIAKGLYAIIKDLPVNNKTKLYYECDKDYSDIFYKPFKLNKKDFSCNWPPFSNNGKHYTTNRRLKYCFNIYEVSGWFLKLKVDTDDKRNVMDRNIRYLQPGLKDFDMYYFLTYKTYSNEPHSLEQQIRVWREL